MKIKRAVELGLIRTGARVKTNGAMDCKNDIFFSGTIAYLDRKFFMIDRDDKEPGSGINHSWRIELINTEASIEFESTEVTLTIVKYYTEHLAKCRLKDGKEIFVKFKNKRKRSLKKGYTVNVVQTPTCWTEI